MNKKLGFLDVRTFQNPPLSIQEDKAFYSIENNDICENIQVMKTLEFRNKSRV